MHRLFCWIIALLSLYASAAGTWAQNLEDLVDQRQEEEEELRQIPGADIPGLGEELLRGRIRLPKGEQVERLRISQDREIDPAAYIVGPGDVFQLYIWGELDQSFPFQVDPEGYVHIPTVGAFHVANKNLAEVKDAIIAAAQKEKYPGIDITLTLQSMRFFTVYLTGAVLEQGSFTVHPVTRISDLIERGGGYLDELQGTTIEETVAGKKITRARQLQTQATARRSIKVIHRDGTPEIVDLEMFLATGDIAHNPYLSMGDVVHVGYRQHEVFVFGSVNKEGEQELRPGDTIGTLLTLAGGVSGGAPLEEVTLWRFREDGKTTDVIPLLAQEASPADRVLAALGDELPLIDPKRLDQKTVLEAIRDIELQPKDMLFIRTRSDWQQTPTVHVHGEVRYRGRYRIVPGKTTLREIVEQAGGYTEDASLVQASLVRLKYRSLKDPELERLLKIQEAGGLADISPEDRAYLKTKSRQERGKVAIDFERLFLEGDESQNVLLEGGDVVFFPEKRHTVSLSGQVSKPGLIDFEPGRRVGYYLDQAGGFTWDADKGAARLIRARTGVRERLDKNLLVEAGDEIWVPEKEYRDWWEFTQSTMRTLAETLAIVILVRTL